MQTPNINNKTPGSKNITPCRRIGLSRNFRRISSSCTPELLLSKSIGPPVLPNDVNLLESTPTCSIKNISNTLSTGSYKRDSLNNKKGQPKLKKKKLEFIGDENVSTNLLNEENKRDIKEISHIRPNIDFFNDKENNNVTTNNIVDILQTNKLVEEIKKIEIELNKNQKHEKEIDILKSLIAQWRNGLNEAIEILSYCTDPPEEPSKVLRAFNITDDILLL